MMATPVSELDLPFVSFDPAAAAHRSRRELADADHWLFDTDLGYLVNRYDDVVAILRDNRWHNAAALIRDVGPDEEFARWQAERPKNILHSEGRDHQRLRSVLMPFFSSRAISDRRSVIRGIVDALLDPFVQRGGGEFVTEICAPFPVSVVFRLLGAPDHEREAFHRLEGAAAAARIGTGLDPDTIRSHTERFDQFAERLLSGARDDPEPGLLRELMGHIDKGTLSPGEARSLAQTVLVAGTESTRSQLAGAVSLLARFPHQFRLLRDDPTLAATAADESMRYLGAVRGSARIAATDIVHREVIFPAGTIILVSFSAVNRDEQRFDQPNQFDITRTDAANHLTLGHGIHYCVGASLARLELSEALAALATKVDQLEVDGDITWRPPTSDFWGPATLPLRVA